MYLFELKIYKCESLCKFIIVKLHHLELTAKFTKMVLSANLEYFNKIIVTKNGIVLSPIIIVLCTKLSIQKTRFATYY
jgi:hypothetical protein